eukprot:9518675-Karenia_brevis.AAC.1
MACEGSSNPHLSDIVGPRETRYEDRHGNGAGRGDQLSGDESHVLGPGAQQLGLEETPDGFGLG